MKRRKLILFISIISLLFIAFTVVSLNFRVILNPYYESVLPQTHFIEIRPIAYGVPTPEMHIASDAGEIILGGDVISSISPKYAILIKTRPKVPDAMK